MGWCGERSSQLSDPVYRRLSGLNQDHDKKVIGDDLDIARGAMHDEISCISRFLDQNGIS